ncbi:unnamed protein product [Caenorhabditis auriculariae]|uniref:Uncharacterized protein n=1 Tax=Caenorhabditis auriculariae TaxID=2777116 RepID=A0A8S1H9P3_9PELO|nr:unnamed protein product [Caenorhabditis auriculariae]
METLLTRALYRVMADSKDRERAQNLHNNVDKMDFLTAQPTIPVVQPRRPIQTRPAPTGDVQLQMRLIAQQLCGKLERKYEKRLAEMREKDRDDVEKRIFAIREEFDDRIRSQKDRLEREKERWKEQMKEHERSAENRVEMKLNEREADLELQRRDLSNRAAELELNRENFERMKGEFKRKVDGQIEKINTERQRLAVLESQFRNDQNSDAMIGHEMNLWKSRAEDLEKELGETRKKLSDALRENFRLRDEIDGQSHLKKELHTVVQKLAEEREELSRLKIENRRMGDYEDVKMENKSLKEEISKQRQRFLQSLDQALEERSSAFSEKEKRLQMVASEARNHAAVATERSRELEMERDVLRNELKSLQKLAGKSAFRNSARGSKPENSRFSRSRRELSPEQSSSSLSEGEMEILNIRQRIQNLDEIAKELDASVEHYSMYNHAPDLQHVKSFREEESKVEMYDDFCRALNGHQNTSSPQKPLKSLNEVEEPRKLRLFELPERVIETPNTDTRASSEASNRMKTWVALGDVRRASGAARIGNDGRAAEADRTAGFCEASEATRATRQAGSSHGVVREASEATGTARQAGFSHGDVREASEEIETSRRMESSRGDVRGASEDVGSSRKGVSPRGDGREEEEVKTPFKPLTSSGEVPSSDSTATQSASLEERLNSRSAARSQKQKMLNQLAEPEPTPSKKTSSA